MSTRDEGRARAAKELRKRASMMAHAIRGVSTGVHRAGRVMGDDHLKVSAEILEKHADEVRAAVNAYDECLRTPTAEPSEPVAKLTAEEQRHDGSILILCEAVFKDLGLSPGESMYVYAHPAPELVGWRPIETAPKDGTWILVCKWPLQNPEAAWGIFVHRAAWWADEGDGHGRAAWIVYNSMGLDPECHFEPTHWMPLPAPPAHPAPEDQP